MNGKQVHSPDSADIASKTAETFETLGAGHFPPHSGFFLRLIKTHRNRETGVMNQSQLGLGKHAE